ncbi:MAG: sulfotransferase [Mariprofundaceae bacterium]
MDKQFKYCFTFVCQQGELEIKALLLAASLRRFLRGYFELVAAIPEPIEEWGEPSKATLDALKSLGVRVCKIRNPIGKSYPIGNKMACVSVETDADYTIFMDSDMLCMQEFSPQEWFSKHQFYAKPADMFTFGREEEVWHAVYDRCGEPFPDARVISSVSGEMMAPYFNAGFIAVRHGSLFASSWPEIALLIDADQAIENKRPWLDQIALPVALSKEKLSWKCLDERFNFPLHLKPLQGSLAPSFCHYHTPEVMRREPVVNALVQELAHGIPVLSEHMSSRPEWARLLQPQPLFKSIPDSRWFARNRKKEREIESPELIISGLPRSGTSYLCSLLHRIEDVVAINEPVEIFAALHGQPEAWGVAVYYRDVRCRIIDNLPVQNKLKQGMPVEDTKSYDEVDSYSPKVGRPDFLLCTKNTLAYLARIRQLRQVMPYAPVVVCVRHPLDVIASWKGSFDHLAGAKVDDFPLGGLYDEQLSEICRARLKEIDKTVSPALKRALLWDYLAGLVLANRQDITLVRYEELVQFPRETLQRIIHQLPGKQLFRVPKNITASTVRKQRELLTDEDIQAVNKICVHNAAALGYTCLE